MATRSASTFPALPRRSALRQTSCQGPGFVLQEPASRFPLVTGRRNASGRFGLLLCEFGTFGSRLLGVGGTVHLPRPSPPLRAQIQLSNRATARGTRSLFLSASLRSGTALDPRPYVYVYVYVRI